MAMLTQQGELIKLLEKSLTNFKKSPKSRLTKNYVEVKLKLLEEQWQKFKDNHMILINEEGIEEDEYIKNDCYSTAEEFYTDAKCEMLDSLDKLTPSTLISPTPTQSPQLQLLQPEIKLPRINIPTFSGEYSEWISFHDLYLSLIHNNKTLTNVQKMHYLKSSLNGEAEALLRHISVTDANYDDAWSALKKRYHNKRYIVNSLMKRLMTQKTITSESSHALRMLLDTTNECLSALTNLGINAWDWDPLLVYLIVGKMDVESMRLWEQQISSNEGTEQKLPTYKQLCTFLESRYRSLEVVESSTSTGKSQYLRTKQASFHTAINKNCSFCNGDHFIHHCKEFAQLTLTDKTSFIATNRLCYNCLVPNHTVARCMQQSSCRRCGKKHHSLIHPEFRPSDQVQAEEPGTSQVRDSSQPETHTAANYNVATHYTDEELTKNVLLATAMVKVQSQNGTTHYLRALIDSGSQGSFITESAAQFLGLKKIPINCTIRGLGDSDKNLNSKHMVIFNAHSRFNNNFATPVKACVLKTLTRMLPANKVYTEDWSHLQHLELADPNYDKPGHIDLLLGADVYSEIITNGLEKGPRGSPLAQNTHLGWILSGQLYTETQQSYTTTITMSMHIHIEGNELLQKFWELESDTVCKKVLTEEERRCEQHFEQTHRRGEDGRYIVSLPFKDGDPSCQYGSSREVAERRLLQLERRLAKDTQLKNEYTKVLYEYVELNHMEEIKEKDDREKPTAVYLPHHAVVKNDRTTTKVRVVYDASCKYKNNVSLNDNLMVGPRLQQDLRHIIMRWRQHRVCLIADIVKMYRQIKVQECDFLRILWRDNPEETIKDFRMTRVTFGTASAPYLATKVLQQLANDEAERYPLAASITLKDFYVDDLLTGGGTYEDALLIHKQMTKMLESGGFQLQKWNSNDSTLLYYMHHEETEATEKELNLDITIKTLGIAWNNRKDQFQYSVNLPEHEQLVTKRTIASDVSKLFDPMGWLAPTIIIGKVFLQRLWLTGVTWDQHVPQQIRDDWLKFRSELPYLSEITVERWLNTTIDTQMELYGFSDASTMAYAAVVYARVKDSDGNIHVRLISAKTKVAPVKTVSVPRLELCGAVLLTRLLNEVAEHLNVSKENIYAYTDSQVVLAWLTAHPSKWKTFVANRTSEIISTLPSPHWNHVMSKENPADLASRGVQGSQLKIETLWWMGPRWLQNKEIIHEVLIDFPKELQLEERTVNVLTTNLEENFTNIFERYSTLEKLLRIIATCKRFRYARNKNCSTYLTAKEIETALLVCIVLCQEKEFAEDITCLRENNVLKKNNKLKFLNPFLDNTGILRVGGRLRHANIPEEAKHQIILPNNNPLSKLIIAETHKKTLHGGPTLMLNYIMQRFWILGGKNMIKKEVHKCITCVRHKATTRTQLMADLPKQRVTPTRPFLHSGIDFAGPIDLRMSKGRGCRTYKGYICIFVCMATKAIHIEIVSSMDSESFVASFKRFTARRGHCSDVWSDNATNFIAGNKLLKDMFQGQLETVENEILDQLARDGTTWHNIPASAPHFGGLWEAGVRSIKHHLKRILGNSTLTYEEMSTVTSQIEACLNSRPISPISDNIDDFLPLTPGHFLIGEPPIIVPERSYLDINVNRLNRWQLVQRMVQHFWDRWAKEYLSRLQQRPKWIKKCDNNIEIGMLVLVKDDNLPPGKWALARIIDLHPGNDGLIRVVTLKYKGSIVKRPITKICLLPVDPQ